MSDEDAELERALRPLRREYLEQGRARIAELWSAFAAVQNGDAEGLAQLQVLAHRLAGSGGGYGFPEITRTARLADHFCRELKTRPSAPGQDDLTQLHALVDGIADAFARAQVPE